MRTRILPLAALLFVLPAAVALAAGGGGGAGGGGAGDGGPGAGPGPGGPAGTGHAEPPGTMPSPDIVRVTGAWSRASAGAAKMGVVYMSITGGAADDVLTGASSPVAARTELHESTMDSGMMRMRAVPRLPIPAGQVVVLRPGGYHMMLVGLHQPLKAGHSFPITLTFAHTPPITVTASVKPIGAAAMPMHDMNGHAKTR